MRITKYDIGLTLMLIGLIVVIVLTSCATTQNLKSDSSEPIGPYHIGDPLTTSLFEVEEFVEAAATEIVPEVKQPCECNHEAWIWVKDDMIKCMLCNGIFYPHELDQPEPETPVTCPHSDAPLLWEDNTRVKCSACNKIIYELKPFGLAPIQPKSDLDIIIRRGLVTVCDHIYTQYLIPVSDEMTDRMMSGEWMPLTLKYCYCIKCFHKHMCYP